MHVVMHFFHARLMREFNKVWVWVWVFCQLIFIITATLIIHHSFTLSLKAQNLPFQQILPTLDFFYLPDWLHDNGTGPDLSLSSFYF